MDIRMPKRCLLLQVKLKYKNTIFISTFLTTWCIILDMENNEKNKMNKKEKFPWSYYLLFITLSRLARFYFNGKAIQSKAFKEAKKKGPLLVMCNHSSALDFVFFVPPFGLKKMTFVVAENMLYSTPFLAKVIKKANAITKKQYIADLSCIRNIKKNMDSGVSVALCPEGQVASCGKTGIIPSANGKLMKFLGYPVAVCRTHGSGLSRSKWGYVARRGKVITECDILYTAEQTKELSAEELYAGLVKALDFNEHKYQIENGIKFGGKRRAEGLERILYRCPKCHSKYTVTTSGDTIKCSACGNEIKYAKTGELIPTCDGVSPKRIDLWYDEERKAVAEEVKKDDFILTEPVALFIEKPEEYNYRFITTGIATLDKEKITFKSNMDERPKKIITEYGVGKFDVDFDYSEGTEAVEDEFKDLTFVVRNNESCAFNPGHSIELYDLKHSYRIMFTERTASTEFVLAIEELYKQRKGM